MGLTPVNIQDFQVGKVNDKDSFLLMNDAFPVMENCYNWRGRIKRRDGFAKLGDGRLRRELSAAATGTIDMSSATTATYNIFTALGVAATEPDASVQPGDDFNIAVVIQGSVTNSEMSITTATQTFTIDVAGTAAVTAATIDYSTGDITVTHSNNDLAAATVTLTLGYYPSLPCMGLFARELSTINVEELVAFDTKYAYRYNGGSSDFQEWIPGTTWSGTNSNFFMAADYWQDGTNQDLFWVTNFSGTAGDPIRYTNGSTWTNFLPVINGTNEMHQCRFLVSYKGRLAFNTLEGGTLATSTQYPQRLRYSQNGDPTDQTNGWLDDTPGRGGFIDCPTNEHILSFGFIRDQLIVGMEKSLWAVRYTGNEILPFVFEKINSEFGWDSMRSPVLFDQGVIGIGKKAVTVCDGVSTQRIDEEIPDQVFNFHKVNDGVERVEGIRDFNKELVYWCYPDITTNTFPNRMLVYNYRNKTWAVFKDSFTAFGTHQQFSDEVWEEQTKTWAEKTVSWNSGFSQEGTTNVVAGNQQGYVLVLTSNTNNSPSLAIKSLTAGNEVGVECINHNLAVGDWVTFSGIIGTASSLNTTTDAYKVTVVTDTDNITVCTPLTAGFTYFGGGELTKLENFSLKSKNFNVLEQGKSLSLSYIDFFLHKTANGQFNCNIYSDYNDSQPINDGSDSFYNTKVDSYGNADDIAESEKAYHRFYCNNHGRFSQFELTLSDTEMASIALNSYEVTIDAITLWVSASGRATS